MDQKIFSIKPSTKLLYISAFKNVGLFIIIAAILLALKSCLSAVFPNMFNIFGIATTITFFFILIVIFKDFITISTTYYTLDAKSFVIQTGFFSIKRENLELYRIVDISSQEPFIYRFLGLGNITLHTIDKTDPIIHMNGIENFEEIERLLKEHASKKRPTVVESYSTFAGTVGETNDVPPSSND